MSGWKSLTFSLKVYSKDSPGRGKNLKTTRHGSSPEPLWPNLWTPWRPAGQQRHAVYKLGQIQGPKSMGRGVLPASRLWPPCPTNYNNLHSVSILFQVWQTRTSGKTLLRSARGNVVAIRKCESRQWCSWRERTVGWFMFTNYVSSSKSKEVDSNPNFTLFPVMLWDFPCYQYQPTRLPLVRIVCASVGLSIQLYIPFMIINTILTLK